VACALSVRFLFVVNGPGSDRTLKPSEQPSRDWPPLDERRSSIWRGDGAH
jgi:hypothetical protein